MDENITPEAALNCRSRRSRRRRRKIMKSTVTARLQDLHQLDISIKTNGECKISKDAFLKYVYSSFKHNFPILFFALICNYEFSSCSQCRDC